MGLRGSGARPVKKASKSKRQASWRRAGLSRSERVIRFVQSLTCAWTTRFGFRRCSARTATGCSKARWRESLAELLTHKEVQALLSDEHFSVDGTQVEAWASMKSFVAKDGSAAPSPSSGRNSERDFHGEKRSNDTHASTTEPEAKLYKKGKG